MPPGVSRSSGGDVVANLQVPVIGNLEHPRSTEGPAPASPPRAILSRSGDAIALLGLGSSARGAPDEVHRSWCVWGVTPASLGWRLSVTTLKSFLPSSHHPPGTHPGHTPYMAYISPRPTQLYTLPSPLRRLPWVARE